LRVLTALIEASGAVKSSRAASGKAGLPIRTGSRALDCRAAQTL
jgi:hypothetical protein